MFACMDASLKNVCTASLSIPYTAYHIPGSRLLPYIKISNSHGIISIPPLIFLLIPNGQLFNSH